MIKMVYDNDLGEGDLALDDNGAIDATGGLDTSTLVSMLTDCNDLALANSRRLDRPAWYGDAYSPVAGHRLGSLLYNCERDSTNLAAQKRAKAAIQEALKWMIEQGVAQEIQVDVSRVAVTTLGIKVVIKKADGELWQLAWELTL